MLRLYSIAIITKFGRLTHALLPRTITGDTHHVYSSSAVRMAASLAPLFVDFDANLLHDDLVSEMDLHVKNAQNKGVRYFVVPGSTLADSATTLALAKERPEYVIATAGVHPFRTEQNVFSQDSVAVLEEMVKDTHCLSVGECGLDYSDGFPAREAQIPWFRAHVQLALRHSLPLFLHIREAHEDFLRIMDEEAADYYSANSAPSPSPSSSAFPVNVCVHCFTGTTSELSIYCDRGYYISLSGHVIRMKMKSKGSDAPPCDLSEWLRLIPPTRLLIETDAPYMGFKHCRSTELTKKTQNYPNVPAALVLVAEAIAEAGSTTLPALAEQTTSNALAFFKFADKRY